MNQGNSALGGQWNELGNFTLDQSSYVEMIHDGGTTSTSSADAIRFTSTISVGVVQTYYIYADHLNTPRMIVDQDDTTVWRWSDNRAFGNMLPDEDPDGDETLFEYNLRFAGQYFDSETNLHYNYFRDYDPETGRYLSSDPIGLVGGLNTYGYALQNPLSFVDPFGLYDIFIGGFGDSFSNIVWNYRRDFIREFPNRKTNYFGWDNSAGIQDAINNTRRDNPCEPINLIGHSCGGDTAVDIAATLCAKGVIVDTLITIDPVS